MNHHLSLPWRRAAALVGLTALGLSACDKPTATSPVNAGARPSLDASTGTPASNDILIDNFTDGATTFGGGWWGYLVQTNLNNVVGGTRELGSYNYGKIKVDPATGDMEWGLTNPTSPQFSVSYGTGMGIRVHPAAPDNNTGAPLHLSLTPADQFVVDLAQITTNAQLKLTVVGANGETFAYYMTMPGTIPSTTPVELSAPLSAFVSEWTSQALTAANAAEIDGINVQQFGDAYVANVGGTKFTKLAIERAETVFTSGSNVTAYDPLPGGTDGNWPTDVCTTQPGISKDDPRWANPHSAYVLTGHPWAGTINAPWINAWNDLSDGVVASLYPNQGFATRDGASYFNWTKYTTTVSGNGTFQLDLLADNCSWVYLNDQLVGVQGTDLSKHSYGVTLNGTATLTFLIFDGGGLAGGQFRLATTSTPPAPLVVDNTPPVITPTITGTQGSGDWYTGDVKVTWSVKDDESAISSKTGCDEADVTTNTTAEGQTITCTAASAGGSNTKSVTIHRDATIPTVTGAVTSGTLGDNGWYTTDVGVTWTPSAAGPSGQTLSSDCSQTTLSADKSSYTFTCTVTSGAGLASTQGTVNVKRDATPPVVTYTGNAGTYTVDQSVSIVCTPSDNLSGVASSTCQNVAGDGYTFALGTNNYSATATDKAGNVSPATGTSFTMAVTSSSLCSLVTRWADNAGIANSLCVKLAHGDYAPFRNEVSAQSGKHIAADKAAILLRLANAL